ncbi:MAG: DegV family protein [Clostridia bacterium]|nr:DegV family protein [Clostridia bacterium]
MRKIKIVSDSASDILELDGVDFAFAPMKIITAEREFVDSADLDVDEMVAFLDKYKGKSKTSCPNTNDWLEAFGDADDVICVTITSGLSGSYNSVCAAKQMYEDGTDRRVFIVDSLSAGPEIALTVKKLAEYIKAGMSYEDICEGITQYVKNTGLVFMLKSLKNFANNGRISPIVAKLVGIAGICIVGKASDVGTLDPSHKCRGEAKSLETILSDVEGFGLRRGRVSIGHCQNETAAQRLKQMIEAKFKEIQIEIHKLRGLCSFYAEKGGLLVGFEKA